jgi:polysaccharide pyruvyl transferase WcaK-like protein
MQKKSSYLLYGYFGAANFGDDILLYSAIQNIITQDPNAKFIIRNYGDIGFLKQFGDRIHSADFENIHLSKRSIPLKLLLLMQAYWRCIGMSSTLVVGGGTLIHDKPYLKSTFLLTCLCLIAKIRNRSIIGVGLGTKTITTKTGKMLVRTLIQTFNQINLRDEKSLAQCRALLPRSQKIALTSDLAYALKWDNIDRSQGIPKKIIAVTLVDYFFETMPTDRQEDILENLGNALASFIQDGYRIRLIPLQRKNDATGALGDEIILKKIKIPDSMKAQCELFTIEPTAPSIQAAYDGVSVTVGMRFHSLIFSAMRQIPFVGLAHEPKIDALCDEFLMPRIKLNETSTDIVKSAIQSVLSATISSEQIENNKALAQKNFNAFNLSKAH